MIATPEEFVKIWQTSNNIKDVMEKTGLSYNGVTARAVRYRKIGIPLKNMRRGGNEKLDVDKLRKLAEDLGER